MQRTLFRSLAVLLVSTAAILLLISPQFNLTGSKVRLTKEPGVKYILQWNDFFGYENLGYGPGYGAELFERNNCPQKACFLTEDHSLLAPHDFDAVVFHMYKRAISPLPFLNWRKFPSTRSSQQRYIFFVMEPPAMWKRYDKLENRFNWTMTYRLDSDVVRPYAEMVALPGAAVPAKGWATPPAVPVVPLDAIASNSSSVGAGVARVAWLVSHCTTQSRRELLVERLARHVQHVQVDVFGDCGSPWPKDDRPGFYHMLPLRYHFYLSFENSLCRDYVTEKLFNILPLDIVPVVYGSANYSAVVPPHSYIDARAFPSERHLALYLQYLANHPEEYDKFLWWKKYYSVESNPRSTLCRLCEKLHEQHPPKSYADMKIWWGGDGVCEEPRFPH